MFAASGAMATTCYSRWIYTSFDLCFAISPKNLSRTMLAVLLIVGLPTAIVTIVLDMNEEQEVFLGILR